MRIGIEAQRIFRPKKHGMDVVAIELIRNLQELDKSNEYFIYSRKGEEDDCVVETGNFHIRKIPGSNYAEWEQWKLPAAAKKDRLDVLHCTANTAPLFNKIPLLLTLHDIIYLEKVDFKGTSYQNLGNLYRRAVVPRLVKKTRLILTVSEFERQNIIERMKLPEEKVRVLYNGVSPKFNSRFHTAEVEAFRRQYGLPQQYIMFLGNTAPKKNTLNVIKAYVEVCRRAGDAMPLVLLDYKKELVQQVLQDLGQPGVLQKIIFPGYVPHHQIPLMYHAASLFLYPSLRESFGLPILEAMACGAPVITSNTSSMPEIAGDAAVLIDPFDHKALAEGMIRLLDDEDLRQSYRQKGLERAASFTWKESARQLKEIYEQLF